MKRRKFINYSGFGLAGAAIGTSALSGLLTSCSRPNRQISVALVGCSDEAIGLLSDVLSTTDNITLKQVFDVDNIKKERAVQAFAQSLGYSPEQASGLQSLTGNKDSEVVFIFLPAAQIPEIAMQCIEAGKNLYVAGEPVFGNCELKQLADTADDKNRVVQCGFLMRSNPSVLAAKTYIEEGKLGQVVHIKIFSLQENTGNPAITNRSLDLARFLAGNPGHPVSVYGYRTDPKKSTGMQRQIITWDFKYFTMKCESGSACRYMKTAPVSVEGESAILPWLLQAERVEVYGSDGLLHLDPISGSWQAQGNAGEVLDSKNGEADPAAHIRNFLSAIRSGEKPVADISQSYLSAGLAQMGNNACRENKQLVIEGTKEM